MDRPRADEIWKTDRVVVILDVARPSPLFDKAPLSVAGRVLVFLPLDKCVGVVLLGRVSFGVR